MEEEGEYENSSISEPSTDEEAGLKTELGTNTTRITAFDSRYPPAQYDSLVQKLLEHKPELTTELVSWPKANNSKNYSTKMKQTFVACILFAPEYFVYFISQVVSIHPDKNHAKELEQFLNFIKHCIKTFRSRPYLEEFFRTPLKKLSCQIHQLEFPKVSIELLDIIFEKMTKSGIYTQFVPLLTMKKAVLVLLERPDLINEMYETEASEHNNIRATRAVTRRLTHRERDLSNLCQ